MPRTTSVVRASATRSLTQAQEAEFKTQFAAFAPLALSRCNSTDITTWARAEARIFYHDVNATVPFALTYNSLLALAKGSARTPAQTRSQSPARAAAQQTPSNTFAHGSAFAQDGQATAAELTSGQVLLNSVLYREYNRWWDAFEAEAGDGDEMTAAQRFSLHCARILRTKSGLPVDQITPVVEAWLIQKPQA